MTLCCTEGHAAPRPSLLSRAVHMVGTLAATRRSRHALSDLDAHILRDIGLTREEARAEAERAPWDVPRHWLR